MKTILSDLLLTYAINAASRELTLIDAVAAGGSSPRQFSLNRAGDKVAVSVQNDGWVVVFDGDVKTGKMGKIVAVVGELRAGGWCVLFGIRIIKGWSKKKPYRSSSKMNRPIIPSPYRCSYGCYYLSWTSPISSPRRFEGATDRRGQRINLFKTQN